MYIKNVPFQQKKYRQLLKFRQKTANDRKNAKSSHYAPGRIGQTQQNAAPEHASHM